MAEARRDRGRGIGLADAADGAQDREHGNVGHGRGMGETGAFEPDHLLGRKALAELAQQPRLPDPGFSDDSDCWPLAGHNRVEMPPEELDIALAADERRDAPAESEPGPRVADNSIGAPQCGGRTPDGSQLEAAIEERSGRLARYCRVDLGLERQSLETVPCLTLCTFIEPRLVARESNRDATDVDRQRHVDLLALGASTLRGALQRRGR